MPRRVTLTWDDREAFLDATTDGNVHVAPDGDVQLVPRVVVADEMGRCNGRDVERVSGDTWIKKLFQIGDPDGSGATLGIHLRCEQEEGTLLIDVNGECLEVPFPKEREYWEDAWRRVPIPAGALRKGTNEVVIRAVEGCTFLVLIEDCVHPNRSAKSRDGGQTWDFDRLGHNDAYDGEYVVRLELSRHASSGVMTSPPVNVGTAFSKSAVGHRVQLERLTLRATAERPRQTKVAFECRAGTHPSPDADEWTEWKRANDFKVADLANARFVQWRALLSTNAAAATPVLQSVRLSLTGEVERPLSTVRVIEEVSPSVKRSSFPFAHQRADDKRSQTLRERWKLDEVIEPATTEFEKFLLLRNWVRHQWEDGWNRGPLDFCPPWDSLVILELTSRQLALGMCTHYATVMTQCCAALGLVARTQIMRCHCINEVWSNDHGKWVAMDVGGDMKDATKMTYHFEKGGVPMSALEVHRVWLSGDFDGVELAPREAAEVFKLEDRLKLFDRLMIHMRNDELTSLSPGEPEHGALSYQYDGYLHWQDEQTPPFPWFSRYTNREADLYWSVNKTQIHLTEGEREGEINVLLEHCMPNFGHFEISRDGGEWERSKAEFLWDVASGANRLRARAVNAFGLPGIVSQVRLATAVRDVGAARANARTVPVCESASTRIP